MNVHCYKTNGGKNLVLNFLNSLSHQEKAEGLYILSTLESGTVEDLRTLDTKHIEGKVWEIRFRRYNRLFYVLEGDKDIFILHACKKQKNETELKDKNIAIKRAKEVKENNHAI